MKVLKVEIKETNGEWTDAIYIHNGNQFHLFIDKNQKIRTKVHEFRINSEEQIIKI